MTRQFGWQQHIKAKVSKKKEYRCERMRRGELAKCVDPVKAGNTKEKKKRCNESDELREKRKERIPLNT